MKTDANDEFIFKKQAWMQYGPVARSDTEGHLHYCGRPNCFSGTIVQATLRISCRNQLMTQQSKRLDTSRFLSFLHKSSTDSILEEQLVALTLGK